LTREEILALMEEMEIFTKKEPKTAKNEKAIVLTIQDNNSKKPWEPRHFEGNVCFFSVLNNRSEDGGEVDTAIVGEFGDLAEITALIESVDELKKRLTVIGIDMLQEQSKRSK